MFKQLRKTFARIHIIIALIISIGITVFWFPNSTGFNFDYKLNGIWAHADLTSPYDFSIKKSDSMINMEGIQIRNTFIPYYKLLPEVQPKVLRNIKNGLPNIISQLNDSTGLLSGLDSAEIQKRITRILNDIYGTGILKPKPGKEFAKVHLINDNTATLSNRNEFYSETQAAFLIDNKLSVSIPDYGSVFANFINLKLEPNIIYDSVTTNQLIRDSIQSIFPDKGAIKKGDLLIRKGQRIGEEEFRKINSLMFYLENNETSRNSWLILIGEIIVSILLFIIYFSFLHLFAHEVYTSPRKMLFVLLLIISTISLAGWLASINASSYYVIPFCITPIVLRTFFRTRLALYSHLLVVMICGFIVPSGIEFVYLNIIAGMVAIFTNVKAHYWSQFFSSIAFIFLTYVTGYVGFFLMKEGSFANFVWWDIGWLMLNVFFTLLAYPLILIFEKLFGYVSDITLRELGDTGKPLLKRLSVHAPGTFQHSMQVANLSEAASNAVGANGLLAKVGSMYHDIGKMHQPTFFIENQRGETNPHDSLPFEESAGIIIDHVAQGIAMAKKNNLPNILIDFIKTHHGTMRVEYFFRSFVNENPDLEIDDTKFRYPGPLPSTKETAIVMMADSVEAASKSLKEPSKEDLDNLVEGIIAHKLEQNQFVHCDLTFKDITTVKNIFKKMLYSIYHVRIEYPKEKTPNE